MLYALGLRIRHWLYDEGLLPSHTPSVATICVGNLAFGGTGKTPHTEWLIRTLSPKYKIAVLSRGYGRKSHGFRMADNKSTALSIGDEPMQIHHKFPEIPIAVCADRWRGIKQLQRMVPGLQVVILDDALQHRAITCGLNILLTAQNKLYIDDRVFPFGTLRDLKHRNLAAQAVIITKCPDDFKPIDKRVIENRLHLAAYQQLYFSHIVYDEPPLPDNIGKSPIILTGIAAPEPFIAHIKSAFPKAVPMVYPDHHRFTRSEMIRIADEIQKHGHVFTTEKDYERLMLTPLAEALERKVIVVPIRVEIDESAALEKQINAYLKEHLKKVERMNE